LNNDLPLVFSEYINTELVLAVPDPPTNKTALLHNGYLVALGYNKIALINNSALNESNVGNNNYANAKFLSGGFHSSGEHNFHSAPPLEESI
jgi:hypothetical protein